MRHILQMGLVVGVVTLAAGCSVMNDASPSSGRTSPPPPPQRPVEKCDQTAAQWAVGKTNTENTIKEARKRSGAYMARVLRPGQPTTREFNVERLNLEVDATGRILKAFCG